jgi:hypothetical protein
MAIPESVKELRPHAIWDLLKEGAKLMLPFFAGVGIKQWVHEYATPLMWTAAFGVAFCVAFSDRIARRKNPLAKAAIPTPTTTSKLTIHSARYGNEAHNFQPVSEEMLRRHDGGAIAVVVSNNLVPFDPAPNTPKYLEVEYSYGHGEQYRRKFASIPEGHLLILPEDRTRIDAAQLGIIKAQNARAQSEQDGAAHKKRADELQEQIDTISNTFRTDAPTLIVKYEYNNGRQVLTFVNDSIFAATTIPGTIPVVGNRAACRCELITKDIKRNAITGLTDIIRREPPGTVDTVTLNYSNSLGVEFSRAFTLRRHIDDTVEWKPGPIRLRGSNAVP